MIRSIAACALALALAGCSTLNIKRPVSGQDLASTKRLGVVSILGDNFYGSYVGTTVFNNEAFTATVPEWKVDAFATSTALALLGTNPGLPAAELDRSALSLEQIRADEGKLLWAAAQQQGFDRVVIIRPNVSSNYPLFRPGVGLMERSMFGRTRSCVYAAYTVDVYDVATQQPLAWEWGGGFPCVMGDDTSISFKKQFADYSAEDKARMRDKLQAWLTESMRYALETLTLVSKAPKKP